MTNIRVELPGHLDCMKEREKRKLAAALQDISRAFYGGDNVTVQKILKKFNLKIVGESCEN